MGMTFFLSVLACLAVAQHVAVSAPLGALQADGHPTEVWGTQSADSDYEIEFVELSIDEASETEEYSDIPGGLFIARPGRAGILPSSI